MRTLRRKYVPSKKIESIRMGARFDTIDGSLPWNEVKYFDPRACGHCPAEKFGSCWVSGKSIPEDGKCTVKNNEFDEWRRRERI